MARLTGFRFGRRLVRNVCLSGAALSVAGGAAALGVACSASEGSGLSAALTNLKSLNLDGGTGEIVRGAPATSPYLNFGPSGTDTVRLTAAEYRSLKLTPVYDAAQLEGTGVRLSVAMDSDGSNDGWPLQKDTFWFARVWFDLSDYPVGSFPFTFRVDSLGVRKLSSNTITVQVGADF